MRVLTAAERYEMMSPWHLAYDIQSPRPGDPLMNTRGPKPDAKDLANDPMGHLDARPYDYGTMVNNLVSHYHGSTDDERKQGRMWYKAAHDLFHNFAQDNNITPERAVAYGSAFSPLTDWGDNVHHAQKFMLGYRPGDPDHSDHNWQTAHLNPGALDAFRQQNGRDPSESDEDLHQLADLHADSFSRGPSKNATNDLSDPDARANWMQNIQHKGMGAVLDDHERQKEAWRKSPKTSGPYNPSMAMRPSGIATLGGNIQKAKDLYHAPEDVAQMFKVLGGPKISHFTDNILDDTPINDQGYYEHPNGDWTQNKDLGGTIDSHHIRAVSMPHGGWERKAYASKNPNTDHEYDVFNRGLLDATKHINDQEPDPTKHITPKQLQATVWLKHKNDKDYFERQRNPQTGALISHEGELGGVGRPADWQFAEKSYKSKGKGLGKGPSRAAAIEPEEFHRMPPLWRKLFMSREPQEWEDLLEDYVDHHSPDEPPQIDPRDPHHLGAASPEDFLRNMDIAGQGGTNPWEGPEAEGLAHECHYCGAEGGEECDPRCPTHHSDDPRHWAQDKALIGPGGHFEPGPAHNPLVRQNNILGFVDEVLAGVDTACSECGAEPHELHAHGCPAMWHPDDDNPTIDRDEARRSRARDFRMQQQIGPRFEPPPFIHHNSVQAALDEAGQILAYSSGIVKNSKEFEPFGQEWQDAIGKSRAETGGYSMRPDGSTPPPRSFMVSEPGHELTQPMGEFSPGSAADYGKSHQHRFEDDKSLYQGGWGPEGDPEFFHDLSKAHGNIWDAADAAYDHDQHAFYDTHTHTEPSPLEFRGPDGTHGLWMAYRGGV